MAHHQHANRLVYAHDENYMGCNSYEDAHAQAERELGYTLDALRDTGVTVKCNTVARILGGNAFISIAKAGCKIFADLKLFDVQSTIANDGSWLRLVPELNILTVAEDVHPVVFEKLAIQLPKTIIAPINPLTDLGDKEFSRRGEVNRKIATKRFFERVGELRTKGLVCSPKDIKYVSKSVSVNNTKMICPGIRPSWANVPGDTNAVNALTHQEAIRAGADILVVGSPLRYNGKLRENTLHLLDEIGDILEGERG